MILLNNQTTLEHPPLDFLKSEIIKHFYNLAYCLSDILLQAKAPYKEASLSSLSGKRLSIPTQIPLS